MARKDPGSTASVKINVTSETIPPREIEVKMARENREASRRGDAQFEIDAQGPGEYTATLWHTPGNRLLGVIAISIEA